jgi:hypothetical protein
MNFHLALSSQRESYNLLIGPVAPGSRIWREIAEEELNLGRTGLALAEGGKSSLVLPKKRFDVLGLKCFTSCSLLRIPRARPLPGTERSRIAHGSV